MKFQYMNLADFVVVDVISSGGYEEICHLHCTHNAMQSGEIQQTFQEEHVASIINFDE